MSETGFLLIRHAESSWNAAGRWQGTGDPRLSERGRRQARALARELRSERIDRLVTSDLARARQTATALGDALELTPQVDARLRELDIGDWTGLTWDEIARIAPDELRRFERGDPDAPAGGAETRRDIRRRAREAVHGIAAEQPGQRVAIVTHLGVIRALLPGTELDNGEWRWVRAGELAMPSRQAPTG
jgi:broad specificity phosphatase PhoE